MSDYDKETEMTQLDLIKLAYRTVAGDLDKMLFDRREIRGQVDTPDEIRFVHAQIRSIVEDLHDHLNTYASDRGFDLEMMR